MTSDEKVSATYPRPWASRLGYGENGVLAAWHSASEILRVEASGVTEIPLQQYDGWIFGMTELDKNRYVVAGWAEGGGILQFDAKTGAYERRLFEGQWLQGLTCSLANGNKKTELE